MYTILVIEDDKEISNIISMHVEGEDRTILYAYDGKQGLTLFEDNHVDLVIVDIMLPILNGYQVVREIRKKSNIPIVILSSKNQKDDKILGLNIGADDYIEKPFSGLELAARVNAQLRRFYKLGSEVSKNKLQLRELTLDVEQMKLLKSDDEITLTSIEFKILKMLMMKPGRVYTKTQIYNQIFGDYFESDENTVMVHISNLRSKIETDSKNPEYIKTIRGLGYKIE